MARPALMESLTRIAEPVVHSKGLEIWGMEILQSGRPVVRIFVDAPPSAKLAARAAATADRTGRADTAVEDLSCEASLDAVSQEAVSIDQCAEISRMVGLTLEVEEVFASAYVLEVSSPGLSRTFFRLEQMAPYVGDMVELALMEAHPDFPGRKKFRGQLTAVTDGTLTLSLEAGAEQDAMALTVAWDQVRKAARVHVFVTPEKPGKQRKDQK